MSDDHFSGVSGDYARFRPGYPEALFDWVAGLCSERGLAWDVACGSGQATRELAARFENVVGTDAIAAQLQGAPPILNVEWRVATAGWAGFGLPGGGWLRRGMLVWNFPLNPSPVFQMTTRWDAGGRSVAAGCAYRAIVPRGTLKRKTDFWTGGQDEKDLQEGERGRPMSSLLNSRYGPLPSIRSFAILP